MEGLSHLNLCSAGISVEVKGRYYFMKVAYTKNWSEYTYYAIYDNN